MLARITSILFFCICTICAYTQNLSNLKQVEVQVGDTVSLDSLSIIPGSLSLIDENGKNISDADYEIDNAKSQLIWKQKPDYEKYMHVSEHFLIASQMCMPVKTMILMKSIMKKQGF